MGYMSRIVRFQGGKSGVYTEVHEHFPDPQNLYQPAIERILFKPVGASRHNNPISFYFGKNILPEHFHQFVCG